MYSKTVLLKSILTVAVAGTVFLACNKGGTDADGNGRNGAKGASDRTEAVAHPDSEWVSSFHEPPGSDWRFTPGTGLYNFPQQGLGGTGRDTASGSDPAAPDKTISADTGLVPKGPAGQ